MKLNILKTDCLHHRELAKEKKKKVCNSISVLVTRSAISKVQGIT